MPKKMIFIPIDIKKIVFTILLLFCGEILTSTKSEYNQNVLRPEWLNHSSRLLDDHKISQIYDRNINELDNFNEILDNILIPRVVGTPGHKSVKKYLINTMTNLKWSIETDKFDDNTPNGKLTFENIIATLNSNAKRFLVLACHFDSKYFPNTNEFLGASDSAVPCAMMIDLAIGLAKKLDQNRENNEFSLKFIFFDGEEAFKEWSDTDSIYGARNLAAKWEKEDKLRSIDMLVLLDLLGLPDPTFYSFFSDTESWYSEICDIETRLNNVGQLEQYDYSGVSSVRTPNQYFRPQTINSYIEDDHIPFLQRGVPILHVIPVPFPTEWHKLSDNRDAIDMTTVKNLNQILRIFVVQYLHLKI